MSRTPLYCGAASRGIFGSPTATAVSTAWYGSILVSGRQAHGRAAPRAQHLPPKKQKATREQNANLHSSRAAEQYSSTHAVYLCTVF